MQFDRFRHDDVPAFLALADEEGWICDQWEFDFQMRSFPQGCLVMRQDEAPVAFVTSIKYGRSGWIGNLLVHPGFRGAGIGSGLMRRSLAALADAGARTVWLTASPAGKAIYERLGFVAVDTIKRWCGEGIGSGAVTPPLVSPPDIAALDRAGWGDARDAILREVLRRGRLAVHAGGFLVCQHSGGGLQLGPWGAVGREPATRLLDEALTRAGDGTRVFLDVPVRNVDAAIILLQRGFDVRGSTTLMFLGETPDYTPSLVYALASMGSMG